MPSGTSTDEEGTSSAAPDGDQGRVEPASRPASEEAADAAHRWPEQAFICDNPTGFSGQPTPEPHHAALRAAYKVQAEDVRRRRIPDRKRLTTTKNRRDTSNKGYVETFQILGSFLLNFLSDINPPFIQA